MMTFGARIKNIGANTDSILENIINTSLDGVVGYDSDFRYIVFNEAMERLTGLSKEDVLGRVAHEVFPFLKTTVIPCVARALAGETVRTQESVFVVNETGRQGFFDAVYSPVVDNHGKIISCVGVVRDVTERRLREQKLLESELKYRSLTQNANDAIVSFDAAGQLLSFNAGAERLFGYSQAEVNLAKIDVLLPVSFWKGYVALAQRGTEAGVLARAGRASDLFLHRKGGSSFPVDVTLSSWKVEDRFFFSAIIRDMSRTHHLEAIAEEQQELYQALMQAQSDLGEGVAIANIEGTKYFYVNEALAQLLGYTRDELMAMAPTAMVAPEQKEMSTKRLQKMINAEVPEGFFENVLITKGGARVHVDVSFKSVETSHGPSLVALVRDISHRKEAEQALLQTEIRMREILKSAVDIITVIGLDGVVQSVNPTIQHISGFEPSDILNINYVNNVHPDDVPRCEESIREVAQGKRPPPFVVRGLKKDGSYAFFEVSSSPVIRANRVVGVLSISRDITDRMRHIKALEDEQARSWALAEASFDALCVTDGAKLVDANSAFLNLYGYSREELMQLNLVDLCAPQSVELIKKQGALPETPLYSAFVKKKDGTIVEVEIQARSLQYKGRTVRVSAIRPTKK